MDYSHSPSLFNVTALIARQSQTSPMWPIIRKIQNLGAWQTDCGCFLIRRFR